MWNLRRDRTACRAYEAKLESYLDATARGLGACSRDAALVAEVEKHLKGCARCRQALEDARLAGALLRGALEVTGEPSTVFAARVAASIRAEQNRRLAPVEFWRPLELLASRLAVIAAVVLLVLTVYTFEYAPRRTAPVASQPELTEGLPEPPAQPANKDDVLLLIAERSHGR